jgi:hypothetical protein
MSGRVLFEHQHRGELIRLEIASYKGGTFGNLRRWYWSKGDGDWRPTGKGCTVPLEALPALSDSLAAYCATQAPDGPVTTP